MLAFHNGYQNNGYFYGYTVEPSGMFEILCLDLSGGYVDESIFKNLLSCTFQICRQYI